MPKTFKVLGGGIVGMTAAIILASRGHHVTLYSKDLGGEYLSGGLKYIHSDFAVGSFIDHIMLKYGMGERIDTKEIRGMVCYLDNDDIYKMDKFPELFHDDSELGKALQDRYWLKTRGSGDVDRKCMNDPWNRTEPEMKIDVNLNQFMFNLISEIKSNKNINHVNINITKEHLDDFLSEDEPIIYTIPITLMKDFIGINFDLKNQRVWIARFAYSKSSSENYDYIYFPDDPLDSFPFHRLSINHINRTIDFEINDSTYQYIYSKHSSEFILADLKSCINALNEFGFLNIYGLEERGISKIPIKGQIVDDVAGIFMDVYLKQKYNLYLVGRYAQWNKRVTYDKAVERIMSIINDEGF
jgi:hypothetical protein